MTVLIRDTVYRYRPLKSHPMIAARPVQSWPQAPGQNSQHSHRILSNIHFSATLQIDIQKSIQPLLQKCRCARREPRAPNPEAQFPTMRSHLSARSAKSTPRKYPECPVYSPYRSTRSILTAPWRRPEFTPFESVSRMVLFSRTDCEKVEKKLPRRLSSQRSPSPCDTVG